LLISHFSCPKHSLERSKIIIRMLNFFIIVGNGFVYEK
jgi:hypothetical protein